MRKSPAQNAQLKAQNWVSLGSNHCQCTSQTLSTQITQGTAEIYHYNQQLELTVLTDQVSMLLQKGTKNSSKPRFTDLQKFEKQNFPGHETAQTSMNVQFEITAKLENLQNIYPSSQLQELYKTLQVYKRQSQKCMDKSDNIYSKHIEIINEYYKQLHLMIDVQKNKHYNNILIMKKNMQSRVKINSQISDIYIDQLASIMRSDYHLQTFDRNIQKFRSFVKTNHPRNMQIYQFQLGNIEDIKAKFEKLIKIQVTQSAPQTVRRQKAQSMGPRLKVISPTKPRYSIANNRNNLVIEEQVDLNYTDGEHSAEELFCL